MCAWNTVGGGRGAERRQARITPGLAVLIHCALWDLVESFKWGVIWFKDHSNLCSGSDSPAAVRRSVCEPGQPGLCCLNRVRK